jgi:hypothetical protein
MNLPLQKMFSEIDKLTPEEQLTVMEYLVERMKKRLITAKTKRKWSDLKGMASHPLFGEDAQQWVSQGRR